MPASSYPSASCQMVLSAGVVDIATAHGHTSSRAGSRIFLVLSPSALRLRCPNASLDFANNRSSCLSFLSSSS